MKMTLKRLLPLCIVFVFAGAASAQQGVTRYVRYSIKGGPAAYGILDGDTIRELRGQLFADPKPTGRTVRLSDATLLIPIDQFTAGRVIGVADNYAAPGADKKQMSHPRWFSKLPSSLSANGGEVELPSDSTNLNSGGDLVLVIGRTCRHVSVEEASNCIFGVTVGNDWTEGGWYAEKRGTDEPSRFVSKSHDTWAGLHDVIYRGLDYRDLQIQVRLNGGAVARGRTSEMLYDVPRLIADVTVNMTLMPGDLIYVGATPPAAAGARTAMRSGDRVEVEIERIGTLRQTVVPGKTAMVIEQTAPVRPGVTRYVRYSLNGAVSSGIREGDVIRQLSGNIFDGKPTGATVRVSDVKLLAPLDPLKVQKTIGVGGNYQALKGPPRAIPHPRMFAKSAKILLTDGDDVEFPPEAANFNYEGELVFVLGSKCRNVSEEQAPRCIFGVMAGNDWGDNRWADARLEGPTRFVAKSGDTWSALGTELVSGMDFSNLVVTTRYNGVVAGRRSTSEMVNTPAKLIANLSKYFTFLPGDIFYTGTVGFLQPTKPGDVVEIEVEGLGIVRNTIIPTKIPNAPNRD
jgi:2-keto-4-pentenoate hydratase/2-oxohepta-3-ene-1,7-dioic acid hydratase in catechol pathway